MSEKSDGDYVRLMKARMQAYCMSVFAIPRHCCCFLCFTRSEEGRPFWTPEADETIITNNSYNESFESDSVSKTATITTAPTSTQSSPRKSSTTSNNLKAKLANDVGLNKGSRSPNKSPFASPVRRNSESESEDSFSFTHSETGGSDQSDVEGRIRALNNELAKRKREAEQLKKEAKRRDKERLKAQEASLKKQIEAYDKYIDQINIEISKEETDLKQQTKPVIKQPADSKKITNKKAEELARNTPPALPVLSSADVASIHSSSKYSRSESESSRSSVEEVLSTSKQEDTSYKQDFTSASTTKDTTTTSSTKDATTISTNTSKQDTTQGTVTSKPSVPKVTEKEETKDSSISESIYSSPVLSKYISSSKSEKKTSTPEKDTTLPSFTKSPVQRDDSSEVISEVIDESIKSESSASVLKLDLHVKVDKDEEEKKSSSAKADESEATDYQTDTFAPDTARTDTGRSEIIDEVSAAEEIIDEHSLSAKDSNSAPLLELDQSDSKEKLQVTDSKDQLERSDSKEKDSSTKVENKLNSSRTEPSVTSEIQTDSVSAESEDSKGDKGAVHSIANSEHSKHDSAPSVATDSIKAESDDDRSYSYSESSRSSRSSKYSYSSRSGQSKSSYSNDYSSDYTATSAASSKSSVSGHSVKSEVEQSNVPSKSKSIHDEIKEKEPVIIEKQDTKKDKGNDSNDDEVETDDEISDFNFSDAQENDVEDDSPRMLIFDNKPEEPVKPETQQEKSEPSQPKVDVFDNEKEQTDRSFGDESEDSELERVISSAAAAVEEFSTTQPTEQEESPHDEAQHTQERDSGEVGGKSRSMILEMLADEVEEESDGVEYIATPRSSDESKQETETSVVLEKDRSKNNEKQESLLMKQLLDESINTILSIRKRKSVNSTADVSQEGDEIEENLELKLELHVQQADLRLRKELQQDDIKDISDTIESSTPIHEKPSEPTLEIKEPSQFSLINDPFEDELKTDKISVGQPKAEDKPSSPFPSFNIPTKSPLVTSTYDDEEEGDDLDKLYDELGALTGDGDEWFDDDFGLGGSIKQPPPYPIQNDQGSSSVKSKIVKVAEEPFYAIPHTVEEVSIISKKAFDVFWDARRCGVSWKGLRPPKSYYDDDKNSSNNSKGATNEALCKEAHKDLVFDLVGEILMDIYRDEDDDEANEAALIGQPRKRRMKYFKGHTPPTHPEHLIPLVSEHVTKHLGLSGPRTKPVPPTKRKWSSRKKRDAVDEILLAELKEEEPQWVDYQRDEYAVKCQVADSIFENLLLETGHCMAGVSRKNRKTSKS